MKMNYSKLVYQLQKKKNEIAAKISQGVTIGRILNDFRNNIGSNLKIEDLINRADLHNIKQKYNIITHYSQLHKVDATSVDIWVEYMIQQRDNNPVQYYKEPGNFFFCISV